MEIERSEAKERGNVVWEVAPGEFVTPLVLGESSGETFSLFEVRTSADGGPPLHSHDDVAELFHVLEGEIAVTLGSEERILGPGQSCAVPIGVAHRYSVRGQGARFLATFTPGGRIEHFFAAANDLDRSREDFFPRLVELAQHNGMRLF